MIRNVGKKITVNKYVEAEELVIKEKIKTIFIRPDLSVADVTVEMANGNEKVVGETLVTISGENYNLLFSDDVFFDEGKQEGSYRESDLWKLIDKVSNELQ